MSTTLAMFHRMHEAAVHYILGHLRNHVIRKLVPPPSQGSHMLRRADPRPGVFLEKPSNLIGRMSVSILLDCLWNQHIQWSHQ